MADKPLISVIVPLYCAEAYLCRCVESILSQTYRAIELILVDDGSTDGSGEICDGYANQDARVRVIHQPNMGVSAARNSGISAARGERISFVDADDWVENDYLSYLSDLLDQQHVAISACNHFVYAKSRDYAKFPPNEQACTLDLRQALDHILYHLPPDVSPWGKLYQASVFQSLRYPEGKIFEDTYRIADLLCAAGTIAYGPLPKYHYRYHRQTLSKGALPELNWDFLDAVDHMIRVIRAHYPDLDAGCARRRVHAALSIRRLLVHAPDSALADLERVQTIICAGAKTVLRDRRAPVRDKIGILLSLAGRRIFDTVWGIYDRIRNSY